MAALLLYIGLIIGCWASATADVLLEQVLELK
jgi:hypothetical protein